MNFLSLTLCFSPVKARLVRLIILVFIVHELKKWGILKLIKMQLQPLMGKSHEKNWKPPLQIITAAFFIPLIALDWSRLYALHRVSVAAFGYFCNSVTNSKKHWVYDE